MGGVSTTETWDDLRESPVNSTEGGPTRYIRRARHRVAYTVWIRKPKPKGDGKPSS